jgi:hypothetical protein
MERGEWATSSSFLSFCLFCRQLYAHNWFNGVEKVMKWFEFLILHELRAKRCPRDMVWLSRTFLLGKIVQLVC